MTDNASVADAIAQAYREADDLDSNHARWVIQRLADRLEIEVAYPLASEPNNRLREQLANARDDVLDELKRRVRRMEIRSHDSDDFAATVLSIIEDIRTRDAEEGIDAGDAPEGVR